MCWQTLAPVLFDGFAPASHASVVITGVVRVGDPAATRTVYTSVVVLVALGLVLAVLAVWVFRRTRPDPELLAPLETMQTRGWRKLDPAAQRRSLDEARPVGAEPMQRAASAPPVDSSFATIAPVASFDDLSDGRSPSDEDRASVPSAVDDETDTETDTEHETDETARLTRPPSGDAVDDVAAPTDADDAPDDTPDEVDAPHDESGERARGADDTGEIVDDEAFDDEAFGDDSDNGDPDDGDQLPEPEAVHPIDPLLAPKQASPDLSI